MGLVDSVGQQMEPEIGIGRVGRWFAQVRYPGLDDAALDLTRRVPADQMFEMGGVDGVRVGIPDVQQVAAGEGGDPHRMSTSFGHEGSAV